jgi:protein-disulfide isomerase
MPPKQSSKQASPSSSPKRFLPFAIILVVLLAAVGAAWAMFRNTQEPARPSTTAAATSQTTKTSSSAVLTGATPSHEKGGANATVTLEEFADLQCPSCAVMHTELQKILGEYGTRVRFVFRHFPLTQMHKNALAAAIASESAARQGKFWEMQDQLYRNQKAWSDQQDVRQVFYEYARTIGLDADRFMRDLRETELRQRIQADAQRGAALGVTGTPTLYLNGRQLTQSESTANGLRVEIDAALRNAVKGALPSATIPVRGGETKDGTAQPKP